MTKGNMLVHTTGEREKNIIENNKWHAYSSNKSMALNKTVKKAISGDKNALYELCENNMKSILFRTTLIIGNQTDAEDVSQEILLRMCDKIGELREPKAFKLWLGRIISNEISRYIKDNSKFRYDVDIEDYIEVFAEERKNVLPQEYAETQERREVVNEIISDLPIRQKEAVILHYYDGLSIIKTAEVMGVSQPNVTQLLAIARDKIKQKVKHSKLATGKAGIFSFMPVGMLLSKTLGQASTEFVPTNTDWFVQALKICGDYILAATASGATVASVTVATTATATGAAATAGVTTGVGVAIAGAACALIAVTAVTVGYLASDFQHQPYIPLTEALVIFSCDAENDDNNIHVNPRHAKPKADAYITVIQWWITSAESDEVLYSDDDFYIADAFLSLRESGQDGEYLIFFRVKSEAGSIYRISGNFYILSSLLTSEFGRYIRL